MDLEFAGKVIALTGASHGPCLAVAERLAAEGAAVAIAGRSARFLAEAHDRIEQLGGRCLAYACDLAVPGEAAAFIATVHEIFGRLDGLVCNGGMTLKGGDHREAWQAELALNVGHSVEAAEAAQPLMHAPGCIVFIGGLGKTWPSTGAGAALAQAARHFGDLWAAQEIRVNHLRPADQNFADSAAFLLSRKSGGISRMSVRV